MLFPVLKKQNESAALGLVAGYLGVLFGLVAQHSAVAGLSALPVAVFEFSLGVWLVVKGFDAHAVAVLEARSGPDGQRPAADPPVPAPSLD